MKWSTLSHFFLGLISTFLLYSLIACDSNEIKNRTPPPVTGDILITKDPTFLPTYGNSQVKTPTLLISTSPEVLDPDIGTAIVEELKINEVNTLVWSPSSTSFVIAGRFDGRFGIALFEIPSAQPKWFSESGPIFGLAFTLDGENVVYSPSTGLLTFIDVENGIKTKEFANKLCAQGVYRSIVTFEKQIYAAFASGGKSTTFTTQVDAWDIDKGTCDAGVIKSAGLLRSLEMNKDGYLSLNLSKINDERAFAVQLWDTRSKSLTCSIENSTLSSINPIGKEIVVIQEWLQGEVWDIATCQIIRELSIRNAPGQITYSPTGNILALAEKQIEFLDMSRAISLNKITNLPNSPNWPRIIQFSHDGSLFAAVIPRINDQKSDVVVIWKIKP